MTAGKVFLGTGVSAKNAEFTVTIVMPTSRVDCVPHSRLRFTITPTSAAITMPAKSKSDFGSGHVARHLPQQLLWANCPLLARHRSTFASQVKGPLLELHEDMVGLSPPQAGSERLAGISSRRHAHSRTRRIILSPLDRSLRVATGRLGCAVHAGSLRAPTAGACQGALISRH